MSRFLVTTGMFRNTVTIYNLMIYDFLFPLRQYHFIAFRAQNYENYLFFCAKTRPNQLFFTKKAIFSNFLFDEFQNLGYIFICKLFEISTPDFFDPFVYSFLNSAPNFSQVLWSHYKSITDQFNFQNTIEKH